MIRNLKLGTKLNILLLTIFLTIVIVSGVFLSFVLGRNAEQIVTDKALLLIETMLSVRNYTSTQVNPELAPRLETEDQFLPQTVPGYSAREVFDNFRSRPDYQNFFYKEATLNPTNIRDKADGFETTIVDTFRNNTNLKEQTGYRSVPGGNIFYIARPISVSKESCLRCHSTPDAAPKSQLATYGDKSGFGWKLNDIVGVQMISVPASEVFNAARRLQFLVIGILSLFLLLAILLINLFLKATVTNPIKQMAQLAKKVSTGDMSGEFKHPNNDEIGILAASLN
ncbi:MAG: c-type heme family protein, partial [Brasilonema sp.]